jgi:signal transduction histidine kinase/CHASE3 domain sensor protein
VSGNAVGDNDTRQRRAYARSIPGTLPLILVVVALLGSVAIPARQTWRITRLLRETTQVLAPSRLLVEQLQTDVARELSSLQSYALTGNPAWLSKYRNTAEEDERRLVTLERLAAHFDPQEAAHVAVIRTQIDEWHRRIEKSIGDRESRAGLAAALQAADAPVEASIGAIASLSSELAAEAAARNVRMRSLERFSIVSNAVLVLAALVAVGGVGVLALRERRLTETLRRRVSEESALREAAEALSGAYTVDEVTKLIAHAALEAVAGSGAFLKHVENGPGSSPNVVVRAAAGSGVPPVGSARPFAGSCTEWVTTRGEPMLLANETIGGGPMTDVTLEAGAFTIVVPMGTEDSPIGALFIVGSARAPFHAADVERARIFGHLAVLAYEKVRLLEEAHDRRRALERMIHSRSRLMRGFSHDVKNPIGAADGFAELLSLGIYGELSTPQQVSVGRIRRNIHRALSLIDDLHELARAETGNLALRREPVNLAIVVRALFEEYLAAAQARGLSLSMDLDGTEPVIETDESRVRQISDNLVSNAIKYTENGSITLRARYESAGALDANRGWAVLEVEDTGIGVPANKQGYIFEEFSRLRASDGAGAGLGLAISKLLAEGLGGHISVTSEVGQGSSFALWLPLVADES